MAAVGSDTSFASSPFVAFREGRVPRRLIQLYLGLLAYGLSLAMMVRGDLGLSPWDVLHQGIVEHTPFSFGTVVIGVSFLVLLAWIPLRQWPGLGTISNAIVIGLAADLALWLLPVQEALPPRVGFLVGGVLLNGLATAAYIGARLGPGPRDGLMTGLVARTGGSVRVVRTGIEISALVIGWMLGGTVGLGTVLYALSIGPLVHVLLPRLTVPAVVRTGDG